MPLFTDAVSLPAVMEDVSIPGIHAMLYAHFSQAHTAKLKKKAYNLARPSLLLRQVAGFSWNSLILCSGLRSYCLLFAFENIFSL
jgi:hypothetical protein